VPGEPDLAAVNADRAHKTVLRNVASASRQICASPLLDGDRCPRALKATAQCGDASSDRGGRQHMLKR